jgi:hypothetical protein
MTTEFITYNFPSCVCENLILLIVVLERLFWPIVFFAFIGLSISPPENEVNVTNLVIKRDWSEINKDDDNESSESESESSESESESSHSEYVDETDDGVTDTKSELSIWEDEDEDDVNDSDYVEETEEESDSDDSNDSGYDDEEETIVITPKIKLYRPNYCLRSSKSLIIV